MAMTLEQQRAVAKANARLRLQQQQTPSLEQQHADMMDRQQVFMDGPVRDFGEGANVGIAQTFGAPVDLVNAGLSYVGLGSDNPVGGSSWMQNRMEDVGIPASEVRGATGQVGQVVGGSTAAMPLMVAPFLRGAAVVQSGAGAPAQSAIRGAGETIAGTALQAPGRFMAAETGLAASAGLGGVAAQNAFPDVPQARMYGELAGGIAPGVAGATMSQAARAMPGLQLARSLGTAGGTRRATERLRGTFDNPDDVSLWRPDVLEDANLTPAQRTESPRTLQLERSVMDATDETQVARDNQLRDLNETVRGSFNVGDSTSEATSQYLRSSLEDRIQNAVDTARRALDSATPGLDRETVNREARKELDAALQTARQQENALYDAVDQGVQVGTGNVRSALDNLMQSTAQAQQHRIPASAVKYLGDPEAPTYLGEATTINEIRGLQSELRLEARQARAAGDFNSARMAEDLANAITDDIAGSSAEEAVQRATAFSKALHQRFTEGEVGDLLGYSRTGEVRAPEGVTLERTVGRTGPAGREGYDALDEAVRFADQAAGTKRSTKVSGYINEYILDAFNRAAVENGTTLNPVKAQNFIKNNAELLKRRPDVAAKLQEALRTQRAVVDLQRQTSPSQSAAGVFLKAAPGSEIDRILRLPEPGKAMGELVRLARADKSGMALTGLKQSFMDRLMDKSVTTAADAADRLFVSGRRLTDELSKPGTQQALRELFSPEELARIDKIRNTAVILDKARTAKPSAEGVMADAAGIVTSTLGRVLGAQLGRVVAAHTGGGTVQTPGIFAGVAQKLLRAGVNDPARRLLNDAIQDEELFMALLARTDSPVQQRLVQQRLNAWSNSVLQEYGRGGDEQVEPTR